MSATSELHFHWGREWPAYLPRFRSSLLIELGLHYILYIVQYE